MLKTRLTAALLLLCAAPAAAAPPPSYDLLDWVRWGGRWFGELNYLSWRSDERDARMWGVSIGAPLAQLF